MKGNSLNEEKSKMYNNQSPTKEIKIGKDKMIILWSPVIDMIIYK